MINRKRARFLYSGFIASKFAHHSYIVNMFRKMLCLSSCVICCLLTASCAPKKPESRSAAASGEIDKLFSRPNCKVTLTSEQFNYTFLEPYKNVERGSVYVIEIFPDAKVTIEEVINQCEPDKGFWGCREVHSPLETTSYLKMPKGIMILDEINEPTLLLEWKEDKKKAVLMFLKRDMQKLIGKDKLELDLKSCK